MLAEIFGYIIKNIYEICNNYGLSIVLFTVFSKIILFPINILVQKNSIKMLKIRPKIEKLKYQFYDDKEKFMDKQIELYEKEKYRPSLGTVPLIIQIPIILGLVDVIKNANTYIGEINDFMFLGINLSNIPTFTNDIIIPVLACVSCLLLCYFQNRENILQRAEGLMSKLITTIITTVFTVYFVFLVPSGVGIYWILGNILAIIQMYILNAMYPPNKYIDYEELEHWQKLNKEKHKELEENKKREKRDYKSFFAEENIRNMKLVFYSEKSGFYKYYKGIIEYIIENSNIIIHYVTSDPNDNVFNLEHKNLRTYYIGKNKLIPLFLKLESDIVVMTTPDLQKYYLKRSIVRKDIEYIYLDHAMTSLNLTLREGAMDYFDTVFASTTNQVEELNAMKNVRNMCLSNIVEVGYPLLDDLIKQHENDNTCNEKKQILIAPSHQEDNILESCIDQIIEQLNCGEYKVVVRPHPQFIQRKREKIEELVEKYKEKFNENFSFELDFSSNKTIYSSDLIITDWSAICFEYSLSTNKPTLFIDTKMKVINKEYKKIGVEPIEISLRNQIGKSIKKEEISKIKDVVEELISDPKIYEEKIEKVRKKYLFNLGCSGRIAGKYIINKISGGK